MLCLFLSYNNVNHPSVYTDHLRLGPPSPRPTPPSEVTTEPWVELPVLYTSFPLAVCFTQDRLPLGPPSPWPHANPLDHHRSLG